MDEKLVVEEGEFASCSAARQAARPMEGRASSGLGSIAVAKERRTDGDDGWESWWKSSGSAKESSGMAERIFCPSSVRKKSVSLATTVVRPRQD